MCFDMQAMAQMAMNAANAGTLPQGMGAEPIPTKPLPPAARQPMQGQQMPVQPQGLPFQR